MRKIIPSPPYVPHSRLSHRRVEAKPGYEAAHILHLCAHARQRPAHVWVLPVPVRGTYEKSDFFLLFNWSSSNIQKDTGAGSTTPWKYKIRNQIFTLDSRYAHKSAAMDFWLPTKTDGNLTDSKGGRVGGEKCEGWDPCHCSCSHLPTVAVVPYRKSREEGGWTQDLEG